MQYPLWDIPTRVFHWTLVAAVALAWWSAEQERYDIHEWTGYTVLVLVVSRIVWGVVGSVHSRFTDFVAGPGRVRAYLQGQGSPTPGHNPLGGWSVLALLTLLLLQAVSGLFNSDDVLFSGPLYYAAESGFRDMLIISDNNPIPYILGRPISLVVIAMIVAAVYFSFKPKSWENTDQMEEHGLHDVRSDD